MGLLASSLGKYVITRQACTLPGCRDGQCRVAEARCLLFVCAVYQLPVQSLPIVHVQVCVQEEYYMLESGILIGIPQLSPTI